MSGGATCFTLVRDVRGGGIGGILKKYWVRRAECQKVRGVEKVPKGKRGTGR